MTTYVTLLSQHGRRSASVLSTGLAADPPRARTRGSPAGVYAPAASGACGERDTSSDKKHITDIRPTGRLDDTERNMLRPLHSRSFSLTPRAGLSESAAERFLAVALLWILRHLSKSSDSIVSGIVGLTTRKESGMQRTDGMMYAPTGVARPVCGPGGVSICRMGLESRHIYGCATGSARQRRAGRGCSIPIPENRCLRKTYGEVQSPGARRDPRRSSIRLVASAAIPWRARSARSPRDGSRQGLFRDKPPLTSMEQLEAARRKVAETGRIYAAYYPSDCTSRRR